MRTLRTGGLPRDAGRELGRAMGPRLDEVIRIYRAGAPRTTMPSPRDASTLGLEWIESLPVRFREELLGVAEGSGIAPAVLGAWYASEAEIDGCSSFAVRVDGRVWVARNNDVWAPGIWGGVTVRSIEGRIPTLGFGVEGDLFVPTGINRERLWLHYNHGPAGGAVSGSRPVHDAFVFLAEALETCAGLDDLERLLGSWDRNTGMVLFAVDGKREEFAVFECDRAEHVRRDPEGGRIVGTNHFCALRVGAESAGPGTSRGRFRRVEELLAEPHRGEPAERLRRILADDAVEQRGGERCTVSANVACPSARRIHFAHGVPTAASGVWLPVPWPWGEA